MNEKSKIEPLVAKGILNTLGTSGTPPEYGIEHFSVGLAPYLSTIEDEYLNGILRIDYSAFKLVVGAYGGGKTHFLYSVRDLAFRNDYAVSYVPLNPSECPFDKLELVYSAIVNNIIPPPLQKPSASDWHLRGIEGFIRTWYYTASEKWKGEKDTEALATEYLDGITGIESVSFRNAVRGAFLSLLRSDEEALSRFLLWIKAEGFDRNELKKHGVMEEISRLSSFRMMRSLIQWVKLIGYGGLLLLFDEAERGMSIVRAREKKIALDNLRQIIDECGNGRLPACMILYAIPDENLLLEGQLGVYEALRQRLRGVFSRSNPSGAKINLEDVGIDPVEFLAQLGEKLASLYTAAYKAEFESRALIQNTAKAAYAFRFHGIGHRRLFVKTLIQCFHKLKENPALKITPQDIEKTLKAEMSQEMAQVEKASDEVEF